MEIRRRRITSTVIKSDEATDSAFGGLSVGASNSDLLETSNYKCIARSDDSRGTIFLDHGRPRAGVANRQSVAVIDDCLQNALCLEKIDRPCRRRGSAGIRALW